MDNILGKLGVRHMFFILEDNQTWEVNPEFSSKGLKGVGRFHFKDDTMNSLNISKASQIIIKNLDVYTDVLRSACESYEDRFILDLGKIQILQYLEY